MPTTREPQTPDVTAAQLRELREQAGLSQREVAALARCSLAWLGNAEGGYIPRRSPTLRRVLEVLTKNERPVGSPGAQNREGRPDAIAE